MLTGWDLRLLVRGYMSAPGLIKHPDIFRFGVLGASRRLAVLRHHLHREIHGVVV